MQVFLDLDGPILNVTQRYYQLYSDLLQEMGSIPFEQDYYWSLKRLAIKEDTIVQSAMPSDEAKQYLTKRQSLIECSDYLVKDQLHDRVAETLTGWAKQHDLYLLTLRRNRETLLSQLEQLGIQDKFQTVFCAQEDNPNWRTKCEWIRSCHKQGVDAVIIGDTEVDVLAGHAAEIRTVALDCGIRERGLLEQLAPDAVLSALGAIDLKQFSKKPQRDAAATSVA